MGCRIYKAVETLTWESVLGLCAMGTVCCVLLYEYWKWSLCEYPSALDYTILWNLSELDIVVGYWVLLLCGYCCWILKYLVDIVLNCYWIIVCCFESTDRVTDCRSTDCYSLFEGYCDQVRQNTVNFVYSYFDWCVIAFLLCLRLFLVNILKSEVTVLVISIVK